MTKRIGVEIKGRVYSSLSAAAKQFGVSLQTAARRLREGYSPEEAFGISTVTRRRQWSESRIRKIVTDRGTFRTVQDAAAFFNIEAGTLASRLRKGWPPNVAVGLEPRIREPKRTTLIRCNGREFSSVKALSSSYALKYKLVYKRIRSGWTPEQAVGLAEPPPRFRDVMGASRPRHWKKVDRIEGKSYPGATPGEYKVYVIRNGVNNREYVGITTSPLWMRLNGHRANARKGRKGKLYNAMRRYGLENFAICLVRRDASNFAQLQQQEVEEILRRNSVRDGYNTSAGGEIGTPKAIRIGDRDFSSQNAAASYYGIDPALFNIRVTRLGWSPEQAAEIEPRGKIARRRIRIEDRTFRSLREAAEYFGVDRKLAYDRVSNKKWTVEQALGLHPEPDSVRARGLAQSAFGVDFPSLAACAKHFGVNTTALWRRVNERNEPVEEAIHHLRKKPKPGRQPIPVTVFGTQFGSIAECATAMSVSLNALRHKMRDSGMSLEEALGKLKRLEPREPKRGI